MRPVDPYPCLFVVAACAEDVLCCWMALNAANALMTEIDRIETHLD